MRPWMSVIVPVHNGGRFLGAALASLVDQSGDELEVVAVDDRSTDHSREILDDFSSRLALRVLRNEQTCGWVAASQRGLDAARGDVACFLHQDDVWFPGRLAAAREAWGEWPDLGLLVHDCDFLDARGRRLATLHPPFGAGGYVTRARALEALAVQNTISVPAAAFSVAAARRVGPLAAERWYTADWLLWIRLADAVPVVYLRRVLAGFRIHAESQTATRSRNSDEFRREHVEVLVEVQRLLDPGGDGVGVPAAGELSMRANLLLAALWHRDTAGAVNAMSGLRPRHFAGLPRFLRYSRLGERLAARLALLQERGKGTGDAPR